MSDENARLMEEMKTLDSQADALSRMEIAVESARHQGRATEREENLFKLLLLEEKADMFTEWLELSAQLEQPRQPPASVRPLFEADTKILQRYHPHDVEP